MVNAPENIDDIRNFNSLINILDHISNTYDMPIIVSTHPRTRKMIDKSNIVKSDKIHYMKPFGFFDYIHLQKNAFCVLSDSGTITEESSILKFPAVNVRNAHERPEGMDCGSVVMAGISSSRITEAINLTVKHHADEKDSFVDVEYYKNLNVFYRIELSHNYIDSINREVWKKDI